MIKRTLYSLALYFVLSSAAFAQVNWLSFDELDSALKAEPKPVFIEMFTEWCAYCKKMEKEVFPDRMISEMLNSEFYAVRFDAESNQEITFNGLRWQRSSQETFHSLALLFKPSKIDFAPPLLVFLNDELELRDQINSYQSRSMLLKKLKKYGGS